MVPPSGLPVRSKNVRAVIPPMVLGIPPLTTLPPDKSKNARLLRALIALGIPPLNELQFKFQDTRFVRAVTVTGIVP